MKRPWRRAATPAAAPEPSDQERQITHGLQSLREASVREVMTPRVDVVALPAPVRLADVMAAVRRSGHSHFPVYRDDPDRLVGVLFLKDLFSMDLFPRDVPGSAAVGGAPRSRPADGAEGGVAADGQAASQAPNGICAEETAVPGLGDTDEGEGASAAGEVAPDGVSGRSDGSLLALPSIGERRPLGVGPPTPDRSLADRRNPAVGPPPAEPSPLGASGSTGVGPDVDVTRRVRDPYVVPETRSALEVLAEMRRRRRGFAVVVDEYGGFAGVLTVNDLVSELVGDLRDEFDRASSPAILRIDAVRFLVDGACGVSEVRGQLGIDLPDGEYVTLGGFLMDAFGRIPQEGDVLERAGWRLRITRMDKRRIAKVVIEAPSAKVAAAGGGSRPADGK
jgi:CBS domain containing-hemolysin-like protein